MVKHYKSIIYDLTLFGVNNISKAMVVGEVDEEIIIKVSFNGGSSYEPVQLYNLITNVNGTGKLSFTLDFPGSSSAELYTIRCTGKYEQLGVSTPLVFVNNSTRAEFQTIITAGGFYSINLPRGIYSVFHVNSRIERVELTPYYSPDNSMIHRSNQARSKEIAVDLELRDNSWAMYAIVDDFGDGEKADISSTVDYDRDGNIFDGETNRKAKYLGILFA
jgi:hypothetical protein